MKISLQDQILDYNVSPYNIHIVNSYRISKNKFGRVLGKIKCTSPECLVWKRKMWSIKFEWAVHNVLYALHIFRSRTKSIDINWPQKKYVNWIYNVIGCFVWILIP